MNKTRGIARRTYYEEPRGKALAEWINQNRRSAYGVLVVAWRGTLLSPGAAALWSGQLKAGGKVIKGSMLELLNKFLKRESAAMLKAGAMAGFRSEDKSWDLTYSEPTKVPTPLHSAFALAKEGALDRLRPCRRCHSWFFARFSHQEFCSQSCQQAFYRDSPEWKSHRAEWMRKYRAKQKRRG